MFSPASQIWKKKIVFFPIHLTDFKTNKKKNRELKILSGENIFLFCYTDLQKKIWT